MSKVQWRCSCAFWWRLPLFSVKVSRLLSTSSSGLGETCWTDDWLSETFISCWPCVCGQRGGPQKNHGDCETLHEVSPLVLYFETESCALRIDVASFGDWSTESGWDSYTPPLRTSRVKCKNIEKRLKQKNRRCTMVPEWMSWEDQCPNWKLVAHHQG